MANTLIFSLCVIMVLTRAESCSLPSSVVAYVPEQIPAKYVVYRVELVECGSRPARLTSRDPNFAVRDGAIVALSPVSVAGGRRTFSVCALDSSGPGSEMEVHLVQTPPPRHLVHRQGKDVLTRVKRRWSPPPFQVLEEESLLAPSSMGRLGSDSSATRNVYYTVSGPGVTEKPVGLFSLDKFSGELFIHKEVDREEFPNITFIVRVFDRVTHEETDQFLPVTVIVDDINDNSPTFIEEMKYTVLEKSSIGTVVGRVLATDRDDPETDHTKIKFTLLSGLDLFTIDPETGVISTAVNTLDREVQDTHLVTVQIKDLAGRDGGLFNTGTATISLGDVNDNPPLFKDSSYAASVVENVKDKLILRIPVEDKDLVNSVNWVAQFDIPKGNENEHFRIESDPKTNAGLLYVTKPLDHEKTPIVKLEIMARNEPELIGTDAKWVSVPVDVTVTDEDEGPEFSAPTVRFTVKENTANGTLIGRYTAVDPETKSSDGIQYYKVSEPAGWINFDRNSGELKVANTIDRESAFVQDGLYTILVKAVDASSKTGTGTVILQVDDVNDNVPKLPISELVVCEKADELGSVLFLAEDKDKYPFSSPFSFKLGPEHDGKWTVTRFNDTAATLAQVKPLPTGIHTVPVDVRDLQGHGRIQTVTVEICKCSSGACLVKKTTASLGGLAILAMLLPLILLLLLCLLIGIFCMTKTEMKKDLDDLIDSGGILLKSNTEAPGEEVDSSLIIVPTSVNDGTVKGSVKDLMINSGWVGNKSASTIGEHLQENGFHNTTNYSEFYQSQYDSNRFGTGQMGQGLYSGSMAFDNKQVMHDAALHHTWQTHCIYLQQKLGYLGQNEEGQWSDDIVHSYGFEGEGSAAGSVGCCSDQGADDNLDFLNALGPKFKTLADVCKNT